jgi:UDP-N-acetyl-D-glucosamine dehydrogenase
MTSVALSPAAIAGYDAVLVSTAHRAFDYDMIAQHARLVVDSRNAMRQHAETLGSRLVKA